MNRDEFLTQDCVAAFADWIRSRLDMAGSFVHSYIDRRSGTGWECDCLLGASETYRWNFRYRDPKTNAWVAGRSLDETVMALSRLRDGLLASIENKDAGMCFRCCSAVLAWGGVASRNRNTLEGMGDGIVLYLMGAKEMLNIGTYCTSSGLGLKMNSGFSKIYSLLVDDFIMYDSRVAAALCLLVRRFCEEQGLNEVPGSLKFHIPAARSPNRDPSRGIYRFSPAYTPKKHLDSNMMANWLLGAVLNEGSSRFDQIAGGLRLTSLQSALFMIGYDVEGLEFC